MPIKNYFLDDFFAAGLATDFEAFLAGFTAAFVLPAGFAAALVFHLPDVVVIVQYRCPFPKESYFQSLLMNIYDTASRQN
jgi:hypothetical protein